MQRTIQSWATWVIVTAVMLSISWRDITRMNPKDMLRDYGSFWASGQAASQHLDPYAVYPLTWKFTIPPGDEKHRETRLDPNLNVPLLLPLFEVFARFDPTTGFKVWVVFASIIAVAGSAFLLLVHGTLQKRQLVWMLLTPAMLDTLWLGQVYILLFALLILIWYLQRTGRDDAAAICIGLLVAMKPNFVLWPALMLLTAYWRRAILAIGVAAVLSALPALRYGTVVYRQWRQAFAITNHSIFPNDISIAGYFERLGSRPLGLAITCTVLLAIAWLTWKRQPRPGDLAGVAVAAAILCSPLAWLYYNIFLVPWLMDRPWKQEETLAAGLTMISLYFPFMLIGQGRTVVALAGAPYFAAAILFVAIFCKRLAAPQPSYESALPGVSDPTPELSA